MRNRDKVKNTKEQTSASSSLFGIDANNTLNAEQLVFNSFEGKSYELVGRNIQPRAYGVQAADIDRAVHDMTFDQFRNCFPQAKQFAHAMQQAKEESKREQERAREEARIEAAKPPNRLRQAYFNYIFVKRCYDVRLGYQMVYINDVEMDRARSAVSQIETSILKEDSSINTSEAWQRAARNVEASNPNVDRYFCQTAYNDLLSRAPYSPPVKDFRGN